MSREIWVDDYNGVLLQNCTEARNALIRLNTEQAIWGALDKGFREYSLKEMLADLGWEFALSGRHKEHLLLVDYEGGDKMRGDDRVFNALCPYISKEAWIEMSDHEGYKWKWVFGGDTLVKIPGEIVYSFKNAIVYDKSGETRTLLNVIFGR